MTSVPPNLEEAKVVVARAGLTLSDAEVAELLSLVARH